MMKKILVVGGNGFIGNNVVKLLLEKKYDVSVYDMSMGNNSQVTYHVGNVLDDIEFEGIISKADVIVYLISAIMPQESMEQPMSSYTTDIPLLIHTLEICKKVGVKRIIYASSGGTIYGDYHCANTEEELPRPINHYAICKLSCERILNLYNELYGMENIIFRLANPYGFGQRPESGVGAITNFAYHMLKDEKITLFGTGENIRDYIAVEEVAKAFILGIEWEFRKDIAPVFNIGSGVGICINRIIQIVSEELQKKPQIQYKPQRNFDVKCNFLDMKKTEKYLGTVNVGDAEENIRAYIRMLKGKVL